MRFFVVSNSREWWYWALTLVCMVIGLAANYMAGEQAIFISAYGFYGVIIISMLEAMGYVLRTGAASLPSQVRLFYAACVIIALFDPTRILYWLLLVGIVMVTFLDYCIITRTLAMMPWNKGAALTEPGEA
jgi:hypothetical protein